MLIYARDTCIKNIYIRNIYIGITYFKDVYIGDADIRIFCINCVDIFKYLEMHL